MYLTERVGNESATYGFNSVLAEILVIFSALVNSSGMGATESAEGTEKEELDILGGWVLK